MCSLLIPGVDKTEAYVYTEDSSVYNTAIESSTGYNFISSNYSKEFLTFTLLNLFVWDFLKRKLFETKANYVWFFFY